MHKRTSKLTQTRRLAWTSLVTLSMLVLLLTVYSSSPTAQAQEPEQTPTPESSNVPPPPGDCWSGALSDDPLHCHILEEAQRAGEIEVAAVYQSPGGGRGSLHIYLRQREPLSTSTIDYLRDKAYEYIETPEAREYYERACLPRVVKTIPPPEPPENCPDLHLQRATWTGFEYPSNSALPGSSYSMIYIGVGGADGRRSMLGWASWTQVWPAPTGGGAGGASGASSGFDVSDVDLTNIPDPDCDEEFGSRVWNSCRSWKEHSGLGIAGSRSNKIDTSYIQVKNAPDDDDELEALKQQIAPGYESSGYEIEIIPVNYDFGELWKWSVILDRFALSAGKHHQYCWRRGQHQLSVLQRTTTTLVDEWCCARRI